MSWPNARLKYMCSDAGQYGLNVSSTDYSDAGVRLIRTSDISDNGSLRPDLDGVFVDAALDPQFLLVEGDLLLSRSGTLGRSLRVPPLSGDRLTFAGYLVRFRPLPEVDSRFLRYVAGSAIFRSAIEAGAIESTIQNFNAERYANIEVPSPPIEEQRRIADFLDAETTRIDSLLDARRRTLGLLDERSVAEIDGLVRGRGGERSRTIAGYAPFGEVPVDWVQCRLRDVNCDVQTGPFGSQLHAEDYVEGGWPIVNPSNLVGGRILPDWRLTVDDTIKNRLSRHVLRLGDVVFGRRGELGRAAVVADEQVGWLCGTGCLRVRFRTSAFRSGYLNRLLGVPSIRHYFITQSVGSTMDNLNTSILLRMPLLVPPVFEQKEIERRCADLEATTSALRGAIEAQMRGLAERRQALITAAVTGQFDVTTGRGADLS